MGPRTYDFSNYQGGFESLVGSALQAGGDTFKAAQQFRKARKDEAQGDEERTLRLQVLKDQQDEVARSHGLSRGGAATAGPTGGTYGNSGFRTPDFNPNLGGAASGPAAGVMGAMGGALGGVVPGEHAPANGPQAATPDAETNTAQVGTPSLAQRVGGLLGGAVGRIKDNLTTGGFRPFEAQPSYVKAGPSDDERAASSLHGYQMEQNAATNAAAMDRLHLTEQGLNARNHEDNVYSGWNARLRADADRRGSPSQLLGALNAQIDDHRARMVNLQRIANMNPYMLQSLEHLSPEEAQARVEQAKQEAQAAGQEYDRMTAYRDQVISGMGGPPMQAAAPSESGGSPVAAALAKLDAQRQSWLASGRKDPAEVERLYQQERAKLLGQSLMTQMQPAGGLGMTSTQGTGGFSMFGY